MFEKEKRLAALEKAEGLFQLNMSEALGRISVLQSEVNELQRNANLPEGNRKVIQAILDHLGLSVREVPAKDKTLEVFKPEIEAEPEKVISEDSKAWLLEKVCKRCDPGVSCDGCGVSRARESLK